MDVTKKLYCFFIQMTGAKGLQTKAFSLVISTSEEETVQDCVHFYNTSTCLNLRCVDITQGGLLYKIISLSLACMKKELNLLLFKCQEDC